MSEEATPQGEDTTQEPHGDNTTEPQGTQAADVAEPPAPADIDWKAEARKHEARAKKEARANAEIRKQLEQLVDPAKVQDAEARVQALETELAEERLGRLRERVARQMQLPDSLAEVLRGTTEDEMREHAERLLADLPAVKPKAQAAKEGSNAGKTPQQSLTPGQLLAGAVFGN